MPQTIPLDRLLRQAATLYRQCYPGEKSRLGRGLEIALNGGVILHPTFALVSSASDTEVRYEVRGTACECPDHRRAPGGRCKHRFAVLLTRIALATMDMADHQEEERHA